MDGFDHLVRAQLKSRAADIGVIVHPFADGSRRRSRRQSRI
jgi:hypothetical protein